MRRRLAIARLRRPDLLGLVGIGGLIGAWALLSPQLDPIRLPSVGTTVSTMVTQLLSSDVIASQGGGAGGIAANLAVTVGRTFIGVAIGATVGIAVGLLIAEVGVLRLLLRPPLEVLRVVPSLVAAPFLILWFGLSPAAQFGLVAVYSMLVLQLNTYDAVRNLPPRFAQFSATLGASRARILRTVTAPAITPELIGGLRVSLQLAWGLEVVAELIGAQRGIGRMMASANSLFRTDIVIAGILWLAAVAVLTDWALKRFLYQRTSWSEGADVSMAVVPRPELVAAGDGR